MGIPSPVKIKRDRVEYVSQVDRANYYLRELTRAALRDVGKFVRRRQLDQVRKLRGLKRKNKRPLRAFQYWVRKRENDLIVGIKHNTWYGVIQELGLDKNPRRQILRKSIFENINEIIKIEAQYLSAIEDDMKAQSLVSEEEYGLNEEEER